MCEGYALSERSIENASLRKLGWLAQMWTPIVKTLDLARLVPFWPHSPLFFINHHPHSSSQLFFPQLKTPPPAQEAQTTYACYAPAIVVKTSSFLSLLDLSLW